MRDIGTVRALQDDLQDDNIDVLLVDIHDDIGQELRRRYNFRVTPTYIIFDGAGNELWRGHSTPTEDEIRQRTG
jgi:hypothetical protein